MHHSVIQRTHNAIEIYLTNSYLSSNIEHAHIMLDHMLMVGNLDTTTFRGSFLELIPGAGHIAAEALNMAFWELLALIDSEGIETEDFLPMFVVALENINNK